MAKAKKGDKVSVHYKGTLDDGTVFDSSEGREPLEFELGTGQVIPGFDAGITGMEKGEKKTIKIPCADAYGESVPEAIIKVPREEVPPHIKPEIGMQLQLMTEDNEVAVAVIKAFDDKEITLDGNHPLAGKDLTFEIELVEIKG